jgi:hypothetical protein
MSLNTSKLFETPLIVLFEGNSSFEALLCCQVQFWLAVFKMYQNKKNLCLRN